MPIAIRVEHVSKEYRLGTINHGMLYKDIQSWTARKFGRQDPHEKIGMRRFDDQADRFWALKDVSFEIEQGERIGIIGRNGAGKSTLLKILSRITEPTEGIIKVKGRIASLLEVGTGFHPELTGRDNIYLSGAIRGMKKREIDRKIDEIIAFSEIEKFIDTPVKRYSSGMFVRLGFAAAAFLDSEILLADEVLAVGDQAFQKKCIGKMEDVSMNQGRTVVFVSHNLSSVVGLCKRGIVLESGRVTCESDIRTAASNYLNKSLKSEAVFENGRFLKSARIRQVSAHIEVEAEFETSQLIDEPCLDVIIGDDLGAPVFAVSSRNYRKECILDKASSQGKITIKILSPRLHNGDYTVSLFFGDSKVGYEKQLQAMRFHVADMVELQYPAFPEQYGFVFPECSYEYTR